MFIFSLSVKGLWINGECLYGIKYEFNVLYVVLLKNDFFFFYINSFL